MDVSVKYSPKMAWIMRRLKEIQAPYLLTGTYPHYTITGPLVTSVATPEVMSLPDHDKEFNHDV